MRNRFCFLFGIGLVACLFLGACRGVPPATETPTGVMPSEAEPVVTATVMPTETTSGTELLPYPGPGDTIQAPYPGPPSQAVNTVTEVVDLPAYPAPQTSPAPTTALGLTTTPEHTPEGPGISVTPSGTFTATPSITPTPTEHLARPIGTPPSTRTTITIWHSWDDRKIAALEFVIKAFQDTYPNIYFNVLFVPIEELRGKYEAAVYQGEGPSIMLGPAEWGAVLFDNELVADLSSYATTDFLATINPAALGTVQYRGALIGLPYTQRGVLLYRNTNIISEASATFTDLVAAAQAATRDGRVGAYLEYGALFSVAHLNGLGGHLMNENGDPAFNDAVGVKWLDLLVSFGQAGATGFNTNRDTELFKEGKIGIIIDGSWNRASLATAIGNEYLVIDPWPTHEQGNLSGYVQTDNLYLNANLLGDDRLAALQFMGSFFDMEVQAMLSEFDMIPVVVGTQPSNEHIQQAMVAFSRGTSYPPVSNDRYLSAYWDALEIAIRDVVESDIDAAESLQKAFDAVVARLAEIRGGH